MLDELFADPSLPAGVEAGEVLDLTVELRFHFAADLDVAKAYFPQRYDGDRQARYGLLASSRDKSLTAWGIPNGFHSTSAMRLGPWYGDGDESHRSCRHLRECVTEFGAQGLELDGVLLTRGRNGAVIYLPPLPELDATAAWDMLRLNGTRYVRPEVLQRRIAAFEFATKADGGAGLEIADLVVTPLGRWIAGMPPKPDLDVVRSKLRRGPKGDWEGAELVVLPKENGRGPLRNTRPRPV